MAKRSRPKRGRPKASGARSPARGGGSVAERPGVRIDLVEDGEMGDSWVHTHGLDRLGLPELEIRSVAPRFMSSAAATLLGLIADYLIAGTRPVEPGDAIVIDDHTCVRLVPATPVPEHEDHYRSERWTVEDLPPCPCPICAVSGVDGGAVTPMGSGRAAGELPN